MLATYHGPHVLILDEPTNHLDIDSREALIMAVNDFEGAVILISHDRHIIETCADELWLVRDGTVKPYDGDLEDYTRLVLGKPPLAQAPASPPPPSSLRAAARPPSAQVRKLIQQADLNIIKIKDKLAVLDAALADPLLYKEEPKKASDFSKLRNKLAADLEREETRWLELHEGLADA
jgi:ATP-binding cassette subfamily F protein 3